MIKCLFNIDTTHSIVVLIEGCYIVQVSRRPVGEEGGLAMVAHGRKHLAYRQVEGGLWGMITWGTTYSAWMDQRSELKLYGVA